MRTILKSMMDRAGDNAHAIFRKTGIHPSTIYRYFNNPKGSLEPETVRKLARIYGISESQLRGDVPIDGMETPAEKHELKDLLTLDEYRLMSNVQNMDPASRDILYRLAETLAEPPANYHADQHDRRRDERRKVNIFPNPQSRVDDMKLYPKPQQQRRLKNHVNGRHHIDGSKSQTA